jgi:hypothetical protein
MLFEIDLEDGVLKFVKLSIKSRSDDELTKNVSVD